MKHLITSLVLLVFITSYTGCIQGDDPKAPIDQLPPLTTTGENTFGCLVNGEAYVVRNTLDISAIYQGGGVQISCTLDDERFDRNIFMILLDPLEENKSYDLTNVPEYKTQYRDTGVGQTCRYAYEDTYKGSITFSKIDRANFIISGIFDFSTVTQDCDTVRITDGRFDMQYIP